MSHDANMQKDESHMGPGPTGVWMGGLGVLHGQSHMNTEKYSTLDASLMGFLHEMNT